MMRKRNYKKSVHILKDIASGVQVGDIKQVNVYIFSKYIIRILKIGGFLQSFVTIPSSI